MKPEAALRLLLSNNRDAIVTAVGEGGGLVALPESLTPPNHRVFGGRFGIELVIADDQRVIMDAWARAQHEPVVCFEVHLLAAPDQLATIHLFDLRREHGVHIAVLEGQAFDVILRSSEASVAKRRGVAHAKKDAIS